MSFSDVRACGSVAILLISAIFFAPGKVAGAGAMLHKQTRPGLETYLKKLGYTAIPLQRGEENQLLLTVQFQGKDRLLIVDTGCSVTTIVKSMARHLKTVREQNIQVDDPVLKSASTRDLVLLDKLKLGPVTLLNEPASVQPLRAAMGNAIGDGFLGMDFLLRHHCLLDCADLRLYLRGEALDEARRKVLTESLEKSGYYAASLRRTPGLLDFCKAEIEGEPMELLVDTGSFGTVLDTKTATRCHLVLGTTRMRAKGFGKGRDKPINGARLKDFKLDGKPFGLYGIYVKVVDLDPWDVGRADRPLETVSGLLGSELLAVNGGLIDVEASKLWFQPAEKGSSGK